MDFIVYWILLAIDVTICILLCEGNSMRLSYYKISISVVHPICFLSESIAVVFFKREKVEEICQVNLFSVCRLLCTYHRNKYICRDF
jgi:hypothetical protein